MTPSIESRLEQRAAMLRIRFDRRIVLVSFAACFVLVAVHFLWLDPLILLKLSRPGAFFFTVMGIPAMSLLGLFFLRIALSPFIDGYYNFYWRKWHTDIAASEVLDDVLKERAPGYLDEAQKLVTTYHVGPVLLAPVTHRAFARLLDAEQYQEALDLGTRLGLPQDVVNQARRRLLAKWESTSPDAKEIAELRDAVTGLLNQFDAIDGLVRNMLSGEAAASGKGPELVKSYARQLERLGAIPPEAFERLFAPAVPLRIAQVCLLLGQSFLMMGDRFQARCHLERAVQLNPNDRQGRLLLSRLHYEQQNYPLALSVIEAQLEKFPDDLVSRYHWEDCVRALSRR